MNVKDYLSRYHKTKHKIELLQAEVKDYIRLANSIPGINFDAIRVEGTKNLEAPFEKWIQRALDNELLIEDMKTKLPIIKGEIISAIEKLEDSELKRILIYRYIDWLTWNEIADEMFLSNATVRRRHSQAIAKIVLPERLSRAEQG